MELEAPAKLNLFLHVLGRRSDGYHLLETLMCCIGLHDTLTLEMGGECSGMTCSDPELPCDETNLVMKAASVFNRAISTETRISPLNYLIHLTKHIPMGAGLGGGSSDAAAVLRGLNDHYGRPFDQDRLLSMALQIGADVPFFIHGRPAIATGVGEVLAPFSGLSPWGVVLVYPGFALSTRSVFKNLNFGLTKCKKQLSYSPFNEGKLDIARHLWNDLESVAVHQFPVIEDIKKELLKQGAEGALMTGSGSAVFGLFADVAAARNAADAMDRPSPWKVFATQVIC